MSPQIKLQQEGVALLELKKLNASFFINGVVPMELCSFGLLLIIANHNIIPPIFEYTF